MEIVDNPNITPEGYGKEVIWEGVNLIRFSFAPHYMSNHPEAEAVGILVQHYKEKKIEYQTLRDGEVIILEEVL